MVLVDVTADWCLTCQLNKRLVLDDKGSPQPTGEFETLEADSLVLALGQDVDLSLLERLPGLRVDDGVVQVDPSTMMTGHPGVFAGGDMVPAERNVTVAVGHGKKAARHIDAWLRGQRLEAPPKHAPATFERLNPWYYSDAPKTMRPQLDLARRSGHADDAARYFAQAEQEITRLDDMTGEMLALSRLEGGIPGENRERIDLAAMLRECVQRAALEAQARRIALSLDAAAPVWVSGHPLLLERALDNLIANAIKFSPEGGAVALSAQRSGANVRCTIRDHGPGVPEGELPSLFRPLFRGSNASRAQGHGLGLAIVQRVVRAHGGEVSAHNADGGGLAVEVLLPALPDAPE